MKVKLSHEDSKRANRTADRLALDLAEMKWFKYDRDSH